MRSNPTGGSSLHALRCATLRCQHDRLLEKQPVLKTEPAALRRRFNSWPRSFKPNPLLPPTGANDAPHNPCSRARTSTHPRSRFAVAGCCRKCGPAVATLRRTTSVEPRAVADAAGANLPVGKRCCGSHVPAQLQNARMDQRKSQHTSAPCAQAKLSRRSKAQPKVARTRQANGAMSVCTPRWVSQRGLVPASSRLCGCVARLRVGAQSCFSPAGGGVRARADLSLAVGA